jgi:hypothetical protein
MTVGLWADCWDGVVEGSKGSVFASEHGGVWAHFDEEVSVISRVSCFPI